MLYRTQDAPRYILGGERRFYVPLDHTLKVGALDALELMFIGTGVTALSLAVFIYTRINAKRDADVRAQEEKGVSFTAAQLRAMGDRAPDFRYTL